MHLLYTMTKQYLVDTCDGGPIYLQTRQEDDGGSK
jgi:hypothetical protein